MRVTDKMTNQLPKITTKSLVNVAQLVTVQNSYAINDNAMWDLCVSPTMLSNLNNEVLYLFQVKGNLKAGEKR